MPQVDLSTLNTPELRRLLDATRARGDAKQSYKILQEMAARREGRGQRGGLFLMRRPTDPRLVAVDLGEEQADDLPPMPAWRAPSLEPEASASPPPPQQQPAQRRSRGRKAQPRQRAAAAAGPVAAPAVDPAPPPETEQPLSVPDADPEPHHAEPLVLAPLDLNTHTPTVERPRAPSGLRRGLAAGFVAGAALGAAVGWWGGAITREAPARQAAPAAAPIRTAALTPPPTQLPVSVAPIASEPEPAPEPPAPPAPAIEPPSEAALAPPTAQADSRETGEAMELPAPAAEAPKTAPLALTPTAPVKADACAAEPSPADREICRDPALRRLQLQLRQAYAEALEAHQDRALLRQRQLAWKNARDNVSDRAQLARLYEQRIRKLDAATAEARRQR
jgi:uncharacterized protein YecT (DUF1311 family)